MIKVLIVEDSRTVSQYLEYILSSDPEIEVIGNVPNGKMAIEFVEKNKPDIITMDIDMPVMNGLEATRRIMSTTPVPVIVVTASRNAYEVNISIEALAAGALTVIKKPVGFGHPNQDELINKLISMVKIYSQVKVVKRKIKPVEPIPVKAIKNTGKINTKTPPTNKLLKRKYVVIGISSGGPQVLIKIFSKISEDFPYPILVVQHITQGFLEGMVTWLDRLCKIPIHTAQDREKILPGHIYFAPNKFQMGINNDTIELRKCDEKIRICPSAEYLFNSLAKDHGKDTIAMLLTGMGTDGAQELKNLKVAGAITIAQDEESSLVFGMPGKAVELNGVDHLLNPDQIRDVLLKLEEANFLKKNVIL